MWEPQHLTTLWASTICFRDSFTFFTFISDKVRGLFFVDVALSYIAAVRNIGQGEAQHRKYKRLKLGGGQAYDHSSV
jgi:hypothetical protein